MAVSGSPDGEQRQRPAAVAGNFRRAGSELEERVIDKRAVYSAGPQSS